MSDENRVVYAFPKGKTSEIRALAVTEAEVSAELQ
jgi:hypothetical protein